MRRRPYLAAVALGIGVVIALAWFTSRSAAYVEAAMSLGSVLSQSTNVVLMRVEFVDRDKNLIVYRKVRDIKGTHNTDVIKHNIGRNGLRPDEWKPPMEWAEPGRLAVFFHNGGASETCIGKWWYQAYAGGEWWNHSHGEPFLLRSYCGAPEKLATFVASMMEGREVVVPCMVDGNKEDLHNRRARVQRVKASLKLQDYNPKRDFVGWGGEDFRRLQGLGGFTHLATLGRIDPEAQAISVVDFDGDGKPDLCLIGGSRVVLLQNNGEALSEVPLPLRHGARAAVWADYNGDGKPDLLLATPAGPKLLTNLGGSFRDDSHLLPSEPYYDLTSAAWLDYNGDGKPDILLANGYHGLRLYRNTGTITMPPLVTPALGKWHYLGPVDNTGGKGFEATHPVDKFVDLQEAHLGKDNEKITWKEHNFTDGNVNDLANLFRPNQRNWSAVYLYRDIDVAAPVELPISLGSDDTLTVWLNGQKLLAQNVYRAAAPDQDQLTLKLKKGKNQLLLKICQGDGDWAFYFKAGEATPPVPRGQAFEDVSASVGLGPNGLGANVRSDTLVTRNITGTGRADILYGPGAATVLVNTLGTAGVITYTPGGQTGGPTLPGKVGPVFGDFDADGLPDMVVPYKGGIKLYKNQGKGQFIDVTSSSGDLATFAGWATSAAWGDIDNDGRLDLVVGCLKGPNRFFRNKGDGTFEERTEQIGLGQMIFNTQAVALVDLNGDGVLDMVFANEGQESVVLLGSNTPVGSRVALTLQMPGIGGQLRLANKEGKLVGMQEATGIDGRGGQNGPFARFTLEPGQYQLSFRLPGAAPRTSTIDLGKTPLRQAIDLGPR